MVKTVRRIDDAGLPEVPVEAATAVIQEGDSIRAMPDGIEEEPPFAFCIRCVAALPPTAVFCETCGTRVSGDFAPPEAWTHPSPAGQPAVGLAQPGGPRRIWLALGALIFVAVLAAAVIAVVLFA